MTLKLSEIFCPIEGKVNYSTADLLALELLPEFIKVISNKYYLSFKENNETVSNVCLSESNEMTAAYRTTFNKVDLIKFILVQLGNDEINVNHDRVKFGDKFHI